MDSEIVVTDDELPADVLQAVEAGNKIVAIKRLREATGLGLANAKVLVDRAAAKHAQTNPKASSIREESNNAGFLGILLLIALGYLAYRYFFTA